MMPTNLPDPQGRKEQESRDKLSEGDSCSCEDRAGHRLRYDRVVVVAEMMVNPAAARAASV
jgi:hypothetical protein